MSSIRFRTAAACRIAQIDRNRFNEAVSAGNYRCAPSTVPGSSRLFDENDLIALFVYAQLLRQDYEPKLAGDFAFEVRKGLHENPKAKTVSRLISLSGLERTVTDAEPAELSRDNPVLQRFKFEIVPIRKFVQREMAQELRALGEED